MEDEKKGRPEKQIDFEHVRKLSAMQCTGEEIAGFLGITRKTLSKAIKKEFGIGLKEFRKINLAGGKASLRRAQWAKAMQGDSKMLIFLGKNYLDQKEKIESENINKDVVLKPPVFPEG